jgi:hypothetical protein
LKRLGVFALCAGCSSFDPASYLNGLRVIAIKAEPPNVPAGGSTTLTVLIPAYSGDVDLKWALCMRAGIAALGQSVNPDCIDNETADWLVPIGSGPTVGVTMPLVGPAELGPPDATGGYYLPIRLRARSNDKTVTAIYRLRLALPGDSLNHNPVIQAIEGEPPTLRVSATPDSYEHYPRDGVDTIETLRFFWYATAGEFAEEVTGDPALPDQTLEFDRHPPAPGAAVELYVVAHDPRGGTEWAHRTLHDAP